MNEHLALALTALAVALRDRGWESGPLTALIEAALDEPEPLAKAAEVAQRVAEDRF